MWMFQLATLIPPFTKPAAVLGANSSFHRSWAQASRLTNAAMYRHHSWKAVSGERFIKSSSDAVI